MPVIGIGIDMLTIDDLPDPEVMPEFYRAYFHADEIEECLKSKNAKASLAGRIALKRAALKAVGPNNSLAVREVKTSKASGGEIVVVLPDSTPKISTHHSITHDGGLATAVMIAEKRETR